MKDRSAPPLLVLVFVVLAAGIVAAGYLLYRSRQDRYRTEVERTLTAVADLKAGELSAWRKDRLAEAGVFYKNNAFSALVRRSIERPQDLPLQEELRTWIGRVEASDRYDRVALLDAAGDRWMSVPDAEEPLSSVTTEKAREILRSGQLTFVDFYRNEYTRKVYLRIFVPILDGQAGGRPLGVLMLRIDPEVYLYPFIQRWPTPSETAETLLIRREGNEAVFLNELKFQKNTALTLHESLDDTDLPVVRAVLGQEGIMEGVDYRGVHVLAAVRAVHDSPWVLMARMDAAEVYAPMRERLWGTVLFVVALLFGAAAAVGFIWRQRQQSIYREKYNVEREYRAVLLDQTAELKASNRALEESKRLAECANRAKSEFLANMSHEIRTPMTAILGYADLMADENVGLATRERIAVIKRNAQHLLGLIDDILDLSKIEAGKLQIEPARCSPVQLLAEVVSLMRPQAAAKQLKLNTELAGPLPETVLTDPLRLRQVLVNLVGNAIKFTDQGEVRVTVRLISGLGKGTVPFSSDENRDSPPAIPPRLCFDVTDTGIGMNEEQVEKLFQPFSQVDNSSTRKFGGAGLGLALSKHLVEALGGSIEVRSEPGKGSAFIVMIDPGPLDGMHTSPPRGGGEAGRRGQDRAARPDTPSRGWAGQSAVDQPVAEEGRRPGDGGRGRPGRHRGRPGRARGGQTLRRDADGHADAGAGRLRGHAATPVEGLSWPDHRPDGPCHEPGSAKMPGGRLRRLPAQALRAPRPAGNGGEAPESIRSGLPT
ncbi:MAG: hypothetical protein KKA28_16130 [Planctomycetes bacterium]|nr:hypothetical protein [Planctomycetota bacterium]MCG2685465.1 ATP-binding protein [Planctomycetales bacterium]